jgi:hypothetical protein
MCGETRQNCPKFKMKEYFLGLSGRTDRMKLWRLSLSSLIVALGVLAFSNRFAIGRSTSSGSSPNTSTPDLSGFWQLKFDSENVPRASLAPVAAGVDQDSQARRDMYAIRWCNHLGMPLIMGVPSPLDIRQGRTEVAIASEAVSAARHIYIDGRGHPDMNTYDPQSNGHSIGHWEGDALVVDTVGFSDRGVTSIPGGGFRTADSQLTERFRLLEGGKRLSVVFTWEDPKVFSKPHTYEFRYYKAPAGTYAREYFCDASNADRAKFLSETPQAVSKASSQ